MVHVSTRSVAFSFLLPTFIIYAVYFVNTYVPVYLWFVCAFSAVQNINRSCN